MRWYPLEPSNSQFINQLRTIFAIAALFHGINIKIKNAKLTKKDLGPMSRSFDILRLPWTLDKTLIHFDL